VKTAKDENKRVHGTYNFLRPLVPASQACQCRMECMLLQLVNKRVLYSVQAAIRLQCTANSLKASSKSLSLSTRPAAATCHDLGARLL